MKKINQNTQPIFISFLNDINCYVYKDDLSYEYYKIRPGNSNESKNQFFLIRLLVSSIDKLSNHAVFYDFINYCMNNNQTDVAFEQAVIKTPKVNDYLYSTHLKSIIDIFKQNQSLLLRYINRKSLLISAWLWLDDILDNITAQKDKIKIFNTIFSTSIFKSPDNQKEIYVIFKKHINNQSKYLSKFDKIFPLKDTQFIKSIRNETAFSITFDKNILIKANINNHIGGDSLISFINEHCNYIASNFKNLMISELLMTYKKTTGEHTIYVFCPAELIELNKHLISEVINIIICSEGTDNIASLVNNYDEFIKNQTSIFTHEQLNKELLGNYNKNKLIKI